MLAAIRLDDQARAEVHEVDDVGTDRLLATEFLTVQAMGAQVLPQPLLGVGHVLTQGFGEFARVHTPLPQPLSRKGRGEKSGASWFLLLY